MEISEIGPVPCDEDCTQIGDENYSFNSKRECNTFIKQISRHYPPPEGAKIFIKSNRHDFGVYREVAISGPQEWIFDVEKDQLGVLCQWDEEAMRDLGIKR